VTTILVLFQDFVFHGLVMQAHRLVVSLFTLTAFTYLLYILKCIGLFYIDWLFGISRRFIDYAFYPEQKLYNC